MKQSRLMSFIETAGSTLFGFVITLAAQPLIYPLFGFHPTISDNLGLVTIFTALSVARGYVWRRIGEALHVRRPLSPAMHAVIAERFRQIEVEGWSHAHDDEHPPHVIADAGACYLYTAGQRCPHPPGIWPWADEWWKPADFRRDLVRGCALGIAEIEKFDRNRRVKNGARP